MTEKRVHTCKKKPSKLCKMCRLKCEWGLRLIRHTLHGQCWYLSTASYVNHCQNHRKFTLQSFSQKIFPNAIWMLRSTWEVFSLASITGVKKCLHCRPQHLLNRKHRDTEYCKCLSLIWMFANTFYLIYKIASQIPAINVFSEGFRQDQCTHINGALTPGNSVLFSAP